MEVLKLRENMRLQNSPEDVLFASWLLDIRHGTDVDEKNKVLLPQQIVTYDKDELIQRIYSDIGDSDEIPPPTYFLDHTILAPRNIDIQGTNAKILALEPCLEQVNTQLGYPPHLALVNAQWGLLTPNWDT